MHGVAPAHGRDTGDIQEESVIVLRMDIDNDQKRKSYEDEVLDAIEEEALPENDEAQNENDLDEDYQLLFGDEESTLPKKETKKDIIVKQIGLSYLENHPERKARTF